MPMFFDLPEKVMVGGGQPLDILITIYITTTDGPYGYNFESHFLKLSYNIIKFVNGDVLK
jgi:hypothetical protein